MRMRIAALVYILILFVCLFVVIICWICAALVFIVTNVVCKCFCFVEVQWR